MIDNLLESDYWLVCGGRSARLQLKRPRSNRAVKDIWTLGPEELVGDRVMWDSA